LVRTSDSRIARTPAIMQIQPIVWRSTPPTEDASMAKVRIAPTTIRKMPSPMYMLHSWGDCGHWSPVASTLSAEEP
jgi:hypothetical protein